MTWLDTCIIASPCALQAAVMISTDVGEGEGGSAVDEGRSAMEERWVSSALASFWGALSPSDDMLWRLVCGRIEVPSSMWVLQNAAATE